VLVGFHGQAEDAEMQMERLAAIPGASRWIRVSVQGLNRFYRGRGDAQVVVAGWMTRQDRELAIEDNRAYVAGVLDAVAREFPVHGAAVFAGFSQGVAMAYRAAALPGRRAAGVIALAADIPPELRGALDGFPPVLVGHGNRDPWYDDARMDEDVQRLRAAGVSVQTTVFEGEHEWTPEFGAVCGRFLAEILDAR